MAKNKEVQQKPDRRETIIFAVIIAIIALFIIAMIFICNRRFTFEGMEDYETRLASWTPATATRTEGHTIDGGVLYYGIDCCDFGDNYRGEEDALRRFYRSDVKTADDIGAIAVFYFDRHGASTYKNGATAYTKDCDVYLLEPDTLAVIAKSKHSVYGGSVPTTTSGRDRYGSKPRLAECKAEAQRLIDALNELS